MVRMIALVALALAGADAFAPVPLPASSVSPAARGMGRAVVGGWAATSTRARPTGTSSLMMGLKIGVVGAGPGGLATALALQKVLKPESVTVLERSNDNTPATGGGLQLQGGAAVLNYLGLGDELHAVANSLERIHTRSTGGDDILDLDVASLIRERASDSLVDSQGNTMAYMVMRDTLNSLIASRLEPGTIQYGKGIKSVSEASDMAVCEFADGTTETFDLLIGSDGIRSVVREYVVGKESPVYTGIRCSFAITEESQEGKATRSNLNTAQQWFGDGAYCLEASYGGTPSGGGSKKGTHHAVIMVQEAPEFRGGENANYESGEGLQASMTAELTKRNFPDQVLSLVSGADRCFEVGVRARSPLVPWHKGRVVLMGDAAHAMPPFLGQGANQAIQDGLCLAQQLKLVGSKHKTVSDAFGAFESMRKPHTSALALKSYFLGKVETTQGPGNVGSQFRNGFFNVMWRLGVAQKVFLSGATPVGVDLKP